MVFALGGQHALDELRNEPFDAVVSDMRMPDVDSVAVLRAVSDTSPATARIMLTGYAADDELACALGAIRRSPLRASPEATSKSRLASELGLPCLQVP
jgi:CheY-like chemotaxis protein